MTFQDKTIAGYRERVRAEPLRSQQAEILYSMHEISRLVVEYFDAVMIRHRITHAQWWAIMHIFRNEGACQSDLARKMNLGRAAAGQLISRLERRGWVERRDDPADARIRRVHLKDEALDLLVPMGIAGEQQFVEFMKDVPDDLQKTTLAGVRKILENARESVERLKQAT